MAPSRPPPSSAFLPPDFDPTRPVALIAGQGVYPQLVAAGIRRAGLALRLIAFTGETHPDLVASVPGAECRMLHVGQLGRMLQALEDFGAGAALMAGQITPRRLFHGLRPDLKAARILLALKQRNAETIFGAIAREIEARGVRLLDARCWMDEHLALGGTMTGDRFPIAAEAVAHGIHIARECARLDIGQGCVVRRGTVLAVEAFEGTDEMLRRAGAMQAGDTLFVKCVKAGQDYRFDVPCFGLRTLETLRAAGIAAAALEVGKVIILERAAVLTQARAWKIPLLGYV